MKLETKRVPTLDGRVKIMRGLIAKGLTDPEMRKLSLAVAGGDRWTLNAMAKQNGSRPFNLKRLKLTEARDDVGELSNMFYFYRDNVRYSGDITGVDTFTSAKRTLLEMRNGDCDDSLIAIGTMLGHNGFGAVARCIAQAGVRDENGKPVIAHIYPVALYPKISPEAGIALDATLPNGDIGTEVAADRIIDYKLF